jgi:hypothetical protein
MSRFVTTLRARPHTFRLPNEHSETLWTIRVQCLETWDAVRMDVAPESRVREVKQAAMAILMPDVDNFDEYVVKLHGSEIHAESNSMNAIGAMDGSTLLIMSRRRRPVR